jgi:hypothetical protein
MKIDPGLERCLTYVNCEISPPSRRAQKEGHFRAVTISRQAGSGGHAVAEHLIRMLQQNAPRGDYPWTIFDKNLVEKVLEDHHLPSRLARFMPEDRISEVSDTMDELFGLHPPSWSLVRAVSDTILRLAECGNVIIIGRAASVITAKIEHVLHVRLVASQEKRLKYIQESRQVTPKTALTQLRREDIGRERYVKKYFGRNINDPLLYHLVINTDLIGYEDVAALIANTVATAKPVPLEEKPEAMAEN